MPQRCLIVEPLRIVARDLADTLHDLTGCAPLLAPSVTDAVFHLGILNPEDSLDLAFLYLDAPGYVNSPLRRILEQRGARVVLTAPHAEFGMGENGFPVLRRPFATADVAEILRSLPYDLCCTSVTTGQAANKACAPSAPGGCAAEEPGLEC